MKSASVTDDEELERFVLAHTPKFQALIYKSRLQIEETGGIPHDQFWREVAAENREIAKNIQPLRRKPKSRK